MNKRNEIAVITPVLTKDVSFNEKVEAVDTALKSRASALREIKLKWAAVVQVMNKYEVIPPSRRVDAGQAAMLVQNLVVYQPKPEVAEDLKKMVEQADVYGLTNLTREIKTMRLLEEKFPGIRQYIESVGEARNTLLQPRVEDKEKTKAARDEMEKAVDEYIRTLEAYDETIESVANVKEYIGIMKEIADISAIAQGIKAKE
jgi:hypothetical protein